MAAWFPPRNAKEIITNHRHIRKSHVLTTLYLPICSVACLSLTGNYTQQPEASKHELILSTNHARQLYENVILLWATDSKDQAAVKPVSLLLNISLRLITCSKTLDAFSLMHLLVYTTIMCNTSLCCRHWSHIYEKPVVIRMGQTQIAFW